MKSVGGIKKTLELGGEGGIIGVRGEAKRTYKNYGEREDPRCNKATLEF